MERAVILQFPTDQSRADLVEALQLTDYTFHQQKPILYCRLHPSQIELAIENYRAKDTSYAANQDTVATDGFFAALEAFFHSKG